MASLSVIVPVYNAEKTLERCINSIVDQSYKDFELIIVNDGSIDGSLSIANQYMIKDRRVRVLSQENKGVSAARNYGLQEAKGEWITFVDADDYLDIKCFEIVFKLDRIGFSELILWNRIDVYRNRQIVKKIFISDEWKSMSIENLRERVFYNADGNLEIASSCCRLFRRDIIEKNGIQFDPEVNMGEDMIFMLDYLKVISCFSFIDREMYYRSMREDSAMHGFNPQIERSVILLLKKINQHIEVKEYDNLLKAYQIYVLRGPVTTYLEGYLCNVQNKNGQKYRSEELKNFLNVGIVADAINEIHYTILSRRLKIKLFCIKHRKICILDYWYRRKEYE